MTFKVIKVRGTPKKVILPTLTGNLTIYRRSEAWKIYIPEYQLHGLVNWFDPTSTEMIGISVQDYDNHFIFEVPKEVLGPKYLCSCGAPANIYGNAAYEHGASPDGLKFQCSFLMERGKHSDGAS